MQLTIIVPVILGIILVLIFLYHKFNFTISEQEIKEIMEVQKKYKDLFLKSKVELSQVVYFRRQQELEINQIVKKYKNK